MDEMDQELYQIAERIISYLKKELSPEEEQQFREWLNEDEKRLHYLRQFKGNAADADLEYIAGLDIAQAWQRQLVSGKADTKRLRPSRIIAWSAAAAVVVLCLISWWYVSTKSVRPDPLTLVQHASQKEDVAPGSRKASLVLSDGRQVELGRELSANLVEQNGVKITGSSSGEIAYAPSQTARGQLLMNRLVVPQSGIYNVKLSDGTKVWVNALSELEFPVAFNAHERRVRLKGEAYFEVAADAKRPFKVDVGPTSIEVLGTHFNVNAYKKIKTTLVEGLISVSNENDKRLLKPGQEALVDQQISVSAADLERVLAWKNGEFLFKSDRICDIMDELSRWYNITVTYQGKMPDQMVMSGSISRDVHLSEVLELLSFASDATFLLKDRVVTVKF